MQTIRDRACRGRHGHADGRGRIRARGRQDRHELFHDRRRLRRRGPAGLRRRAALCPAPRQYGRRQEDRNDPARRRRRGGQRTSSGPGDDRQRQGQHHRRRHHADRARLWSARDAGEDRDRRHDLRRLGHDHRVPLFRAHQFHSGAIVVDHGRVGRQERQQTGGHAGQRMGARHRSGDRLQAALHRARRSDRRIDPHPARQPGLRAVPAAHPRHQSGYRVHLFPRHPGRHFRQAVRRARPCRLRHQDHRAGRPHRRRRAQQYGRSDARAW